MQIHPLQPFQVRVQARPSTLQLQALTQFYQPIIGGTAMSVYLHFAYETLDSTQKSSRTLHTQLLSQFEVPIHELTQVRHKLEAVGLLRTYLEKKKDTPLERQTILYDVQLPLEVADFVRHSLLSTLLFQKIGDQAYASLLQQWQLESLDGSLYREVSVTFGEIFHVSDSMVAPLEATYFHQKATPQLETTAPTLDFALLCKRLAVEGVDKNQFTRAFQQEVTAIYETYGLDEAQLLQVILLAVNDTTGTIQFDALKHIASKKQFFDKKHTATVQVDEQQWQQRERAIKEAFPSIEMSELQVIRACEQLDSDAFLAKTKTLKNGFATDNERYYLKEVLERSQLSVAVVNLLVYHLLIWQNKDAIYKGDLQRIANEWQQQKIANPESALHYLRQKETTSNSPTPSYTRKTPSRRKSLTPTWLNDKNATPQTEPTAHPTRTPEEIKARINQLFEKGAED